MSCFQFELSCHLHAENLGDAVKLLGDITSALKENLATTVKSYSFDTSDTGVEGKLTVNQLLEGEHKDEQSDVTEDTESIAWVVFTLIPLDDEDGVEDDTPLNFLGLPGHGIVGRN